MWEGDGGVVYVQEACVGGWFRSEFGVSEARRAMIRSDWHDHLKPVKKKVFPKLPRTAGVSSRIFIALWKFPLTCIGGD